MVTAFLDIPHSPCPQFITTISDQSGVIDPPLILANHQNGRFNLPDFKTSHAKFFLFISTALMLMTTTMATRGTVIVGESSPMNDMIKDCPNSRLFFNLHPMHVYFLLH